jgi:hypothetical protein
MVEALSRRSVVIAPANGFVSTTLTKGALLAATSLNHLKQVEKGDDDVGARVKKGLAVALLGLTIVTGVTPAWADSATNQLPVTTTQGLFLDASQLEKTRFGDVNYGKLFGTQAGTIQSGVIARTQAQSVDEGTRAAFNVFESRLSQLLQRDAGSIASGLRPLESLDSLTPAQQKDLQKNMQRAFTDLVQNVPIGAFSPGVQNTLQSLLGALGNNQDLSTTTLKQFGKLGGDAAGEVAKDFVKDFKNDHPAAFWSLASAVATAAVVVGYTQGTDALAKLGIKPEVKTRIFDDVRLKVGVEAGKQFSNPILNVGLDGQHTFQGGTTIRGAVAAEIHGKELVGGRIDAGVSTMSGFNLDTAVRFDGSGKPFDARLSASQRFNLNNAQGVVFANGIYSDGSYGTTKQATLSGGVVALHGPWTTSVSANYDFNSETFSSSLATGRSFNVNQKNDLDLQIRGSVDNKGNGYLGVGVNFRF